MFGLRNVIFCVSFFFSVMGNAQTCPDLFSYKTGRPLALSLEHFLKMYEGNYRVSANWMKRFQIEVGEDADEDFVARLTVYDFNDLKDFMYFDPDGETQFFPVISNPYTYRMSRENVISYSFDEDKAIIVLKSPLGRLLPSGKAFNQFSKLEFFFWKGNLGEVKISKNVVQSEITPKEYALEFDFISPRLVGRAAITHINDISVEHEQPREGAPSN